MGSIRLPGKVLADLGGRPLLAFLLDRLKAAPVDTFVVATSDLPRDDPVVAVAGEAGVEVVRGPELDVLTRFDLALQAHPAELLVRITADCPFADPALVAEALERQQSTGADYVSNTLVRTFPDGLDVEVMRAAALRAAVREAVDDGEREHVTPFIYRRPERFALATFISGAELGLERWTVDTPEDLAFVRAVVERLAPDPHFRWQDVLAVTARPAAEGHRLAVDPTSHPGRRRWTMFDGDEQVAAFQVEVAAGVGTITVESGRTDPEMLTMLRDLLATDPQIVTLEDGGV